MQATEGWVAARVETHATTSQVYNTLKAYTNMPTAAEVAASRGRVRPSTGRPSDAQQQTVKPERSTAPMRVAPQAAAAQPQVRMQRFCRTLSIKVVEWAAQMQHLLALLFAIRYDA